MEFTKHSFKDYNGVESYIVVKDIITFIITVYYKILDICTFHQIHL